MIRHRQFHVYILECKDGTFYTGYTVDLERRIKTHNKKRGAKYLSRFKNKLPAKLAYCREYRYYKNAIKAERDIKKLSRKQKEKLVGSYSRKKKRKSATS